MRPARPIHLAALLLAPGAAATLDVLLTALTLVNAAGANYTEWHTWAVRAAGANLDPDQTTTLLDALMAAPAPAGALTFLAVHTTNPHLADQLAERLTTAGRGDHIPLLHLAASPHLSPARQEELIGGLLAGHRGLVKDRGGSLNLTHASNAVVEAVLALASLGSVLPRRLGERAGTPPFSDIAARRLLSAFRARPGLAVSALVLAHPGAGVTPVLRARIGRVAQAHLDATDLEVGTRTLPGPSTAVAGLDARSLGTGVDPGTRTLLGLTVAASGLDGAEHLDLAACSPEQLTVWAMMHAGDEVLVGGVLAHVAGRAGLPEAYARQLLRDLVKPDLRRVPLSDGAVHANRIALTTLMSSFPTRDVGAHLVWPYRNSSSAKPPLGAIAAAVLTTRARAGDADAYLLLRSNGLATGVDAAFAAAAYPWSTLRAAAPELLVGVAVDVHSRHGGTGLGMLTSLELGHVGTLDELVAAVDATLAAPVKPAVT